MTKVITRYFENVAQARAVKHELVYREGFSSRIVRIFETAEQLTPTLETWKVSERTAAEYRTRLEAGGAVMVVWADFKPLGVAQTARDVTARMGAVDLGDIAEEVIVKDTRRPSNSVLRNGPHMLTRRPDPDATNFHMADWPIPLISRRKPFRGFVFPPHSRMASWPIGLKLSNKIRFGRFPFDLLVPGQKFMAKFPFDHLVPHNVRYGRFPFGHLVPHNVRYGRFPFGLLVPHNVRYGRFPFGLLMPNHNRMANWPFPLLINGEKHTNSLIPGHKYQAKFPFDHLVPHNVRYGRFPFGLTIPGQKYMAKFPFGHLVPGHKYMAKFPFAHIVPGHKHMAKFPFGHIVPGHKYMANWILPHTKPKAG